MNLEQAIAATERQSRMMRDIGEQNRMQQSVAAHVNRDGDLENLGQLCEQYGADRVHNYIDQLIGVS